MSRPNLGKVREFLNLIRNRLPGRSEILSVFGVIVFICHSWTMLGFLNKLSSFLLYFNIGEILSIFAYMMAFAFLESLAFTGILVLLSAILPSAWLKEGFDVKGFVVVTIAVLTFLLLQTFLGTQYPSTLMILLGVLAPLVLIALAIFVVQSRPKLRSVLLNIQDRFLIMLFIYAPLGILSLVVVLFRILV
jgi:hypothetical protein